MLPCIADRRFTSETANESPSTSAITSSAMPLRRLVRKFLRQLRRERLGTA